MMTKEGSTKIIKIRTPRAGVLVLVRGQLSHISEYILFSTLSTHSTLIATVLRDLLLLSYAIVEFSVFFVGTFDMHIRALLTRNQCRVFDTQVTVNACKPLVNVFTI